MIPVGVLFCLLVTAGCAKEVLEETGRTDLELSVGFPEGRVAGAELGPGQFANMLSLEGLTHVSVDGRALPRLAERWEWENNGLGLRVHLRPGIVFHDGTPLTAAVAARILRDVTVQPGNVARYPALGDIRDISADGDLDLVLALNQPSALLPEELDVSLESGPEHVGTGPYRVVSRSPQLVLERFDRYHLGRPRIARVKVSTFGALRTAWASLLRGELDMVTDVPADAVDFIHNDDVQLISFPRRYQFLVAFNARRTPLDSPAVRRALNLAVNRQSLVGTLLKGYGVQATGPIWPKHWAYDASVQPFGYEPRAAEALLDSVGYRRGAARTTSAMPQARLVFTCLLPTDFSILERIGLDVQKQLFDIGVDMRFHQVPLQQYDALIREGNFDAVLVDLISGPTLGRTYIFWRSAANFKGLNVFGYENAEAERLFRQLRGTSNEAGLRSATHRLQQVFLEDPPALFLAWNERTRAVRRDFRVVSEDERDPILSLWQWTADTPRQASAK